MSTMETKYSCSGGEAGSDAVLFELLQGVEGASPVDPPLQQVQQHGAQQDVDEERRGEGIADGVPGLGIMEAGAVGHREHGDDHHGKIDDPGDAAG